MTKLLTFCHTNKRLEGLILMCHFKCLINKLIIFITIICIINTIMITFHYVRINCLIKMLFILSASYATLHYDTNVAVRPFIINR